MGATDPKAVKTSSPSSIHLCHLPVPLKGEWVIGLYHRKLRELPIYSEDFCTFQRSMGKASRGRSPQITPLCYQWEPREYIQSPKSLHNDLTIIHLSISQILTESLCVPGTACQAPEWIPRSCPDHSEWKGSWSAPQEGPLNPSNYAPNWCRIRGSILWLHIVKRKNEHCFLPFKSKLGEL